MELCDRIPMNPQEVDIVRNELQNPTLVNTRTERPIPKLMLLLYFLCLQKSALYLLLVDQEEPNRRHYPLKSSRFCFVSPRL
jgi:hypothetical protein